MKSKIIKRGIVICGGGYRYFPSVWILVKMLKYHKVNLPIELWITKDEKCAFLEKILKPFGVSIRVYPLQAHDAGLPEYNRWQWVIKPWALINTEFREVLYIDADNFPVHNPEYMFEHPAFVETGAIFWPDLSFTDENNPIWKELGIPYRSEPGFESGQIVIDTLRHREPLEFALKMNLDAKKYYYMLYGDKDTFRFAFHKYGRPFALIPHQVQILSVPGRSNKDLGVMCQHDFEGNRLFQHRNMAKWDLLGYNPRIPGCLFEDESRKHLSQLRKLWNGRLKWRPPHPHDYTPESWSIRNTLVKDLVKGIWLLEDRRPRPRHCCGPVEKWSNERVSKPWGDKLPIEIERQASIDSENLFDTPVQIVPKLEDKKIENQELQTIPQSISESIAPSPHWHVPLRDTELQFAADYALSKGASPQAYWWDLKLENGEWRLCLSNEKGLVAKLRNKNNIWKGIWTKTKGHKLILQNADKLFNDKPIKNKTKKNQASTQKVIHLANHAFGIGDSITGLYAATGLASHGYKVVYHTRFPQWLNRASHQNLTITDAPPPIKTPDMDTDHSEHLRYAHTRVRWYADRVAVNRPKWSGSRPEIDRSLRIPRVDFPRYVVISPFAAWESRDWLETHWRRLAYLIREGGLEIVVIGTEKEKMRIERTFDKSYAYWAIKHDENWVDWVTDLMLGSEFVVGLDSGMIHVAGLLGVPAISIHSHLSPKFLFDCAPSILSVTPSTFCTFCRWQEDRGFNEACVSSCSALATVGPEQVMNIINSSKMKGLRKKWIDCQAIN